MRPNLIGIFSLLVLAVGSYTFAEASQPTGYEKKLNTIDNIIANRKAIVDRHSTSWTHWEKLADAHLERAKLTGRFEDYEKVDRILEQAFSLAGEGSGPFLTKSKFDFTVHRFDQAQESLSSLEQSVLKNSLVARHVKSMRADINLYTGQYESASKMYRQLDEAQPTVETAVQLAHYYSTTGQYAVSEQWLDTAQGRATSDAHLQSWLALQHGIVDLSQGRLKAALKHYQHGLTLFPNYWLIEEHIAEIDALEGRHHAAEKSYRDLIERTKSPLFMTALANILSMREPLAEREEAAYWYAQADSVYQQQLVRLPETVAGHALDYFLDSANPVVYLSLAEKNYRLRPGGEAATQLIQAYSKCGELSKAKSLLEKSLDTDYVSADLYHTASLIYQQLNNNEKAEKYLVLALAINPLISN